MYSSSSILLDRHSEDSVPSYHRDLMFNLDTSGLSTSRLDACSALICSSQLEPNPSADTAARRCQSSPGYDSCSQRDWKRMSGHQAKRERVESIIKGMHCTNETGNLHGVLEGVQESNRIQRLSRHRERGEGKAAESANATAPETKTPEKHLGQLHTTFNCAGGISETKDASQESLTEDSSDTPRRTAEDAFSEFEDHSNENYHSWQKVNCFQSKPAKLKLMANVLKYELSRAVSRSVDSLFKSIPLLQTNDETNTYHPNLFQQSFSSKGVTGSRKTDIQSEALSLVVQKPPLARTDKIFQSKSCGLKAPVLSGQYPEQRRVQVSEEIRSTARRYYKTDGATSEAQDESWNTVKVRSKGGSRSARCPQTHMTPRGTLLWENLCLPQVKAECDSLVRNNASMPNEGLTASHLKKAKLMFFYTRYPSSLVLKMCFHDVQFTRCITSQLIKWFSNFREFYYIQMERCARHALAGGVSDVRGLTVGRESQLFRALNMHYNKANDFQVPDRFLEVAEITLREFYVALSTGKDRDPSWKKAIYKIICKLDSDVPAEFKHSG